jgi:hypothetical protein
MVVLSIIMKPTKQPKPQKCNGKEGQMEPKS